MDFLVFMEDNHVDVSGLTTKGYQIVRGYTHLLCLLQVICGRGGDLLADDNVVPVNPIMDKLVDFSQWTAVIRKQRWQGQVRSKKGKVTWIS